ncbi:N-acetylglucosaminyl deacetylase, LmbE family [Halobacillus karajensis]|uniref:PIG-L family deacetylase n=1 Tax=Halobacillus karajensis TaxID=195088 RepID=UPI0008A771E8|nr:PIG-L family deacetylase [Halobacillus karajensis]SEH43059.1 N-acetylglucosaminyl deacetylase, LmbE family [Halobacillus karajensis]
MKNLVYVWLAFLLMISGFASTPAISFAEDEPPSSDLELWEAVAPLTTTASFMNTGAHPDDERSQFLAYLSRGKGIETSFLLSTRGQGGQNEIGSELGDSLGIIRTNELQASSDVLGIDIFFLNQAFEDDIKDFGFSKSPEETLDKWGESATYERLIYHIRKFKPDVLMPSFRNVDTQHGHHRAMTLLTEKAFDDAADPSVFPEQLQDGLTTWQSKKLYLPAETEEETTLSIEIGQYDEHYDMTYPQLGEKARYLHESQGMGRDLGEGSVSVDLQLVRSTVGDIPEKEDHLYEGIPYDFSEYSSILKKEGNQYKKNLNQFQHQLEKVKEAYPNHNDVRNQAEKAYQHLQTLQSKLEKDHKLPEQLLHTLKHKLKIKEEQLTHTLFTAGQLDIEVEVEDPHLTYKDTTDISVTIKNNGLKKVQGLTAALSTPEDWEVRGHHKKTTLQPGQTKTYDYQLKANSRNYYDAYDPSRITAEVSFKTKGHTITDEYTPEERLALLPEVSLKTNPENIVINTKDMEDTLPLEVTVEKFAEEELTTEISLDLPENWQSKPASQSIHFEADEKEKTMTFDLLPPEDVDEGEFKVTPEAQVNDIQLTHNVQTIDYNHIGTNYYLSNADMEGVAFPLQYPEDLKVGYVESSFDEVADQLINVGMDITKLSEQDLSTADLSQYDTIVTGIRAYLSREDLLLQNERLLEYVNNGGHLVVQYNKPWDNWDAETTAPYPLVIGQPSIKWRVTREDAPVEVLKPESPLFNFPNVIQQSDWDGWVQERGLYFPMDWSSEFETFVSVADPGEEPFEGGILKADYGKGTYIYSNLVWYRQIQNQVPGGYRIFTNLISYPYHNE